MFRSAVSCTVETELCEQQGVQGYPTIKVFRGIDLSSPYQGQRKSDAIVSYMIKQSLPAVSLLDKESHDEFTKADKVVLVAYFNADDKESNTTYTTVAESLRDSYLFGATSDVSLAEAAGVKAPALVLYKTFDEGKDVYSGKFEVEKIVEFAKVSSTPLIGEVGPETYAGYMDAGIPLAYIFVDNDADKAKYSQLFKSHAEKFKGKINFATIDAVAYGAHAGNLNLEQKWPAFSIQETTKNQKFPFDQAKEFSEKALAQFVEDFAAGKLEPSIKSEPVPEKQDGPVHVVVAHNYKQIVNDSEKDVLVEFYAPWCGHCKNLAPKYEELGGLYFNNPDFASKVVVAKVDATTNDVPIEIQGFPTIKLFPAGAKDSPVDYSGSRTVEDLAKFIKEHGTHKVDAYVAPPAGSEAKAEEQEQQPKAEEEPSAEAAAAASKVEEKAEEKVESATENAEGSAATEKHDEL